ncbi:hypothetical protein [Marinobacter confluentis]|uniref:Uncharacterized protein n=1 Tax=Marinobacter confluentis TaxID=1697557 RepID=A0A4Z1B9J4_9GAMM|nr:hypothetical protein [Marinobacter confluentis]TGN38272.1 hypothetical protein E5Q11_15690 [Marinobacter confluentis]
MTINQLRQWRHQHGILLTRVAVFLCALGISSFSSAGQKPPDIPPEIQARLDRLTAPPPKHHLIKVGQHVFKVPVEYVMQYSQSSEDFFSMLIYLPGMIPYKQSIKQDVSQVVSDRVEVLVRDGGVAEVEQAARNWQRRLESSSGGLVEYTEVPSLKTTTSKSASTRVYFAEKTDSILNQEILMILCGRAGPLHEVGTCSTRFSPFPGVIIKLRFDRKTLPQWRDVVSHVSQLLKDFKDDENDL